MTDLRQTPEYTKYMKNIGWTVGQIGKNYVYIRKIPLLGNIAKLQRPSKIITAKEIDKFAKRYKLAVFYFEPQILDSRFQIPGFVPAGSTFLPSKTIHIDLKKSLPQLLSEMKAKTRYNIRLSERKGVMIYTSHNGIDDFIELWQKSARNRGMFLPQAKEIKSLWNAFGNKSSLFFAYKLKAKSYQLSLAGILMVRTDSTAYYMYAASTKDGKKLFAPSLLVWEALKIAKKKGCKIFDFEGIQDLRYKATKAWKGFTHFKEGFGGKVVEYPPTLVKYYNPIVRILRL